jgi:hypothetical protein
MLFGALADSEVGVTRLKSFARPQLDSSRAKVEKWRWVRR